MNVTVGGFLFVVATSPISMSSQDLPGEDRTSLVILKPQSCCKLVTSCSTFSLEDLIFRVRNKEQFLELKNTEDH